MLIYQKYKIVSEFAELSSASMKQLRSYYNGFVKP